MNMLLHCRQYALLLYMKYSKYMYYLIPLGMVISGKEVGIMEEYYSIIFFLCNCTGIMLSPILNNVKDGMPKYAPTGSHRKATVRSVTCSVCRRRDELGVESDCAPGIGPGA